MKNPLSFILFIILFACGNDKDSPKYTYQFDILTINKNGQLKDEPNTVVNTYNADSDSLAIEFVVSALQAVQEEYDKLNTSNSGKLFKLTIANPQLFGPNDNPIKLPNLTLQSKEELHSQLQSKFNGKLRVSEDEFGDTWPLSIPEGYLECIGGDKIILHYNDVKYAVNGTARSQIDRMGLTDIRAIWKDGYNIGPVLNKGLALCK